MAKVDVEGNVVSSPAVNVNPFTVNDNVDVTMDALSKGSPFPRGFITDMDGTLSIVDGNDTVANITVIKGFVYPIVVKRFRTTGTTIGMTGVALN